MTYTVARTTDTEYELRNDAGTVITTFSSPITLPHDIIDAILDDMGVGAPQREAFKVLFTGDWETVDER